MSQSSIKEVIRFSEQGSARCKSSINTISGRCGEQRHRISCLILYTSLSCALDVCICVSAQSGIQSGRGLHNWASDGKKCRSNGLLTTHISILACFADVVSADSLIFVTRLAKAVTIALYVLEALCWSNFPRTENPLFFSTARCRTRVTKAVLPDPALPLTSSSSVSSQLEAVHL
jgi:hypothetical protein